MMRPSSEKPDVNWSSHGQVGEQVGEDAGKRVFDDELIDDPESDARMSSSFNMAPLIWGAAAFAGAVAVGLVLRSRRRRPRWPALLNVTIASAPAPARSAMLSTMAGAVARFAFQRLMAAQRDTLASVEPEAHERAWKADAGTPARSSTSAENGSGS